MNPPAPSDEITRLLNDWGGQSPAVDQRLIQLIYPVLRRIASARLSAERHSPLQTTDLVHEAYLKLVDQQHGNWRNRAQFFAVAAMLVRRILVDQARRRARPKHGGDAIAVTLTDNMNGDQRDLPDWLALDACLRELDRIDATAASVVELRIFGGLTIDETAQALSLGSSTVVRKWAFAKTFLKENWIQ